MGTHTLKSEAGSPTVCARCGCGLDDEHSLLTAFRFTAPGVMTKAFAWTCNACGRHLKKWLAQAPPRSGSPPPAGIPADSHWCARCGDRIADVHTTLSIDKQVSASSKPAHFEHATCNPCAADLDAWLASGAD